MTASSGTSNEKIYLARGNARAVRGDVTVRAETLTAHYREVGNGKTEVYQVVADGGVLITTPREKITGDTGVYDVEKGVFRLTGKSLLIETPEEKVTARDKIEYFSQEKKALLVGDATVVKDNRKVRSDTMTARFAEDAKGKMALSRADIVGNVVITTPTEVARAERGVYNADSGIATLTGGVKLTRGDNQLNGEFAEVNLKTGISRLLAGPAGAAARHRTGPRRLRAAQRRRGRRRRRGDHPGASQSGRAASNLPRMCNGNRAFY